MRRFIFSEEIRRRSTFLWRNNKALHFFPKKTWGAWFFHCRNNISRIVLEVTSPSASFLLQKKNEAPQYSCKKNVDYFWRNNAAPHCFWRINEAGHFFYSRNNVSRIIEVPSPSASLFVQKKMKRLIISEKNEAPHYFFRKKSVFFSEEIMKSLIFFWRNNEAPHFFLKK